MSTNENHPYALHYQPWDANKLSHRLAAVSWELTTLATLFDASDLDFDLDTSLLIPKESTTVSKQDRIDLKDGEHQGF